MWRHAGLEAWLVMPHSTLEVSLKAVARLSFHDAETGEPYLVRSIQLGQLTKKFSRARRSLDLTVSELIDVGNDLSLHVDDQPWEPYLESLLDEEDCNYDGSRIVTTVCSTF